MEDGLHSSGGNTHPGGETPKAWKTNDLHPGGETPKAWKTNDLHPGGGTHDPSYTLADD